MAEKIVTGWFGRSKWKPVAAACFSVFAFAAPLSAQESDSARLAKQLANPISSPISVPFQLNYNSDT